MPFLRLPGRGFFAAALAADGRQTHEDLVDVPSLLRWHRLRLCRAHRSTFHTVSATMS